MKTNGAFGGMYKHDAMRELRAEIAKVHLILAALIDYTKLTQPQVNEIVARFMREQEMKLREEAAKSQQPQ